MMALYS